MDVRKKVKEVFEYLLNVKNINKKIIRNINEYDKFYLESDFCHLGGCSVNKEANKDWWLCINKKSKGLYDNFFKLYIDLKKNSNSFEIVWGHGLLVWKVDGKQICHPAFTTKMELDFDAKEGKFILKPFGKTELELNFMEDIDIANMDKIVALKNTVKTSTINPRNVEEIEEILVQIIHYLSENSLCDAQINLNMVSLNSIKASNIPTFYNCPVIIIRRYDRCLWQSEILDTISYIDNGGYIPKTIQALVEENISCNDEKEDLRESSKDILFPLPSNEEQREIVNKLRDNYGVVVQGPPGTGKSHTIVNLICHLLAQGKRVLVTSQTDRALRVLSEKLPEEIRPLCISILGNDTKALRELDESVAKITDKLSLNPQSVIKEASPLYQELKVCRQNQKLLYDKMKRLHEIENTEVDFEGEKTRLMNVAKYLNEHYEEFSYIADEVKEEINPPIDNLAYNKLILLLKELNKEDIKKVNSSGIMLDKLPEEQDILNNLLRFKELNTKQQELREVIKNWYFPKELKYELPYAIDKLNEAKQSLEKLERSEFKNLNQCYHKSSLAFEALSAVVEECTKYIESILQLNSKIMTHDIKICNDMDICSMEKEVELIYDNFIKKGKADFIFLTLHKKCKSILENVTIDGDRIKDLHEVNILKDYILKEKLLSKFILLWNNAVKNYGGPLISTNEKSFVKLEYYLNTLKEIVNWDKDYKREVFKALGDIRVPELDWYLSENCDYTIKGLNSYIVIEEFQASKTYIETVKRLISPVDEFEDLLEGLEKLDEVKVKNAFKEIYRLKNIKKKVDELDLLLYKVKETCPNFANLLYETKELDKYKNWDKAWYYTKWYNYINAYLGQDIGELQNKLEMEKQKERVTIHDIVVKRTWYNQILRTTEAQKRSLISWMHAVKRIGKGTGKFVSEYRKIAQNEMEICKKVIPVWIMPINKVVENIKLSEELFDVIIFDESSQSDIFSICALMRAKKAVIVGDDKQISPDFVGVDQASIDRLINCYLNDIPCKQWFDLQTSLYDTAFRVFPSRLMLKEHFRCVKEIIQFSNELCYSGEIIPLRYPKNSEMLPNPIVAVKVEEGKKDENKSINVIEAETLSNKMAECCKDLRYKNMTMGVISLLGEAQADLIMNMLRNKIGEEEIVRRKIICGDAYSFQGDERDVMFLSMVIANNTKFATLTKESDIRRFNVAASRAKNQMWLFYSVDEKDINIDCVRYSLVHYFNHYEKFSANPLNMNYVFCSQFRKDLYKTIKDMGYRVSPDVKVGKYNFDFVIEGLRNRLAILCDGEDINMEDMCKDITTQMELERVGWNFFKVRGSEFYFKRNLIVNKLYHILNDMNIEKTYENNKQSIKALA